MSLLFRCLQEVRARAESGDLLDTQRALRGHAVELPRPPANSWSIQDLPDPGKLVMANVVRELAQDDLRSTV
jgi:hypothetical protein